jgi:hypothetical protein
VGLGARALACAFARVASLIQQSTGTHHTVLSFVVSQASSNFSTLSHKRHDFWKNVIKHKICLFSTTVTFYRVEQLGSHWTNFD